MAVTLCLEEDIDIGRGDMISRENNLPEITGQFEANMVWMGTDPMQIGKEYLIKHTTKTVKGIVSEVKYRFDPEDAHRKSAAFLHLNEIGKVKMELKNPVFADIYAKNRNTGSFILIDPDDNQTVAAGMISKCTQVSLNRACESRPAGIFIYTVPEKEEAKARYDKLSMQGIPCIYVDDDILKDGLCRGIAVNDELYSGRLQDLCNIVTKSGVSVIVYTENKGDIPGRSDTVRKK